MEKKKQYVTPFCRVAPVSMEVNYCASPLGGNGLEGFVIDDEGVWEWE